MFSSYDSGYLECTVVRCTYWYLYDLSELGNASLEVSCVALKLEFCRLECSFSALAVSVPIRIPFSPAWTGGDSLLNGFGELSVRRSAESAFPVAPQLRLSSPRVRRGAASGAMLCGDLEAL